MKKPLTQQDVKRYKKILKKVLETHQKLMKQQHSVFEITNKYGRKRVLDAALSDLEVWELIEKYEENFNDLI